MHDLQYILKKRWSRRLSKFLRWMFVGGFSEVTDVREGCLWVTVK